MTTTQPVLSQRVQNLAESETLKMARMARELRALGHDVISLSLGEPAVTSSEPIAPPPLLAPAIDAPRRGGQTSKAGCAIFPNSRSATR